MAATILMALVVAMVIPSTVSAARAERFTQTFTQLMCSDLRSDSGSAQLEAWVTDQGETYADLRFWAGPNEPGESEPTWYGYGSAALIDGDGTSLEITFTVYELGESEGGPPEPSVIGEGTLTATLDPTGDAETFASRDRYGNRQFRSSGSWQALDATGQLRLPEEIGFELTGCDASRFTESYFANSPAVSTSHSDSVNLVCTWSADVGLVTLSAETGDDGTGVWLWIEGDGEFFYSDGSGSLSRSAFEASVDVFAARDDGENVVGSATASAVLATGERLNQTMDFGDFRYTAKGAWLIPDGSLTLELPMGTTTSLAIDEDHCLAADIHSSQLPARHQRLEPVDNDSPEAAIPLKIGDVVTVSTAGAQEAPEASCLFTEEDGTSYEGPITHTVWWRIEGTGDSITVDTEGSTFDTMVGVFVADGSGVGASLGCVDDVDDSLAARITFETAPDAAYLVQTGGFGGSTGDLTIAVTEP